MERPILCVRLKNGRKFDAVSVTSCVIGGINDRVRPGLTIVGGEPMRPGFFVYTFAAEEVASVEYNTRLADWCPYCDAGIGGIEPTRPESAA